MTSKIIKLIKSLEWRVKLVIEHKDIAKNFIHLVFFYFLPSRLTHLQPLCLFKMNSITFYSRRTDLVAVDEIVLRGEYGFLQYLITKPTPIILDLGANIGIFSIFAFTYFPKAIIYSYEASKDTFEILKKNQCSNPLLNWHIYQKAVWNSEGLVNFTTLGASTTRHITLDEQENSEQVQTSTLQNIILNFEEQIYICKIDIEGAEEAVLDSASDVLHRIDNLIVEIHPDICNQDQVIRSLTNSFEYLYMISGRESKKPLLLATRSEIKEIEGNQYFQ